ncbi:hypothetical protein BKK79_30705 [Cupriavidus sp. USMAA2-4]|uniref:Ferritin-like domain-containing protein n=1 Tax=Cupriavidus malaysiensis TaxID=367825 RepID=A0ABM6FBU3_9BURK|nr:MULTISPECIES: diiron oxygenase [Cupriavidus]AOY96021.1 hypothetical protein BKK79_30705 [Cupriavidus sp. USMAA2-4]AOZ03544.1 hypothetical protein BKK81_31340 [Cupriavidus sp. USMAHM13]AOZ09094.1 hypothetical protein BKK80_25010 [Cupriavidus malaysiensis]
MRPSLLEELTPVPNPYPIVSTLAYQDIWGLCEQARALAWDPARIDYSDLERADLPAEVREAGAEWWSLRAWMEHGAIPYGAERLLDAIFSHQPFEVKQHVVNFIAEELRHHEASFRVAGAIGGYQPSPRSDYFRSVIPRFHDEREEKQMSFFAGLAVNTLFEQLSGELLQARYENARFESIRTACRLILRDEARHIQFGRIIMRRFFAEISADDKAMLGQKFAKKLRGSLLNGVYAVVNLPPDEQRRAARARALAAEHGLGATHPEEEMAIIRRALNEIREDVGAHGVEIPPIAEVDEERAPLLS